MKHSPPLSSKPYPWLDMDPWDRATIQIYRDLAQEEHGNRVKERQRVNGKPASDS